MSNSVPDQFMRALRQLEQTGDVEPLVEMFSEDAELSNLSSVEPFKDREGARRFWKDYLSVFREIRSSFTGVIESERAAALEWISEGTLTGGEPLKYTGVSLLEIEGDKIRRFRSYYDSAAFLPQGMNLHASEKGT